MSPNQNSIAPITMSLPGVCKHRWLFGASLVGGGLREGPRRTFKVTRVRDDDRSSLLELVKGGGHVERGMMKVD